MRHLDQLEDLHYYPELVDNAVEEILRHEGPNAAATRVADRVHNSQLLGGEPGWIDSLNFRGRSCP